jgi:CheY-like chemotaxis protein
LGNRLKILIVDAVPRDNSRLSRELEKQGFEFVACRMGTLEAFHASVEGGRPDLILSEIDIGGADGFRALDMARECHPDVPFIFVSQTYTPGLIVEIIESGGNGYVSKHDLGELREVILQAQRSCQKPPAAEEFLDKRCDPAVCPENNVREPGAVKPICPRCKRIGDARGEWEPLEIHLRLHRRATVALGTCPDCADALVRM